MLGAVALDTLVTSAGALITLLIAVILETIAGLTKPSIVPVADINVSGAPPGVNETLNVVELNICAI